MREVEKKVRSIECDGLLWGACKSVYNVHVHVLDKCCALSVQNARLSERAVLHCIRPKALIISVVHVYDTV